MKRLFPSFSVVLFTLGLLALVLSYLNISQASEVGQALNQGLNLGGNGGAVVAGFGNNTQNPTCLDNWENWPNSAQLNTNAQWSLVNFPMAPLGWWYDADYEGRVGYYNVDRVNNQFVDINGDGLQDYVYSYREVNYQSRINFMEDCVMLNTGSGWDVAYQCRIAPDNNGNVHYWGDCALIE